MKINRDSFEKAILPITILNSIFGLNVIEYPLGTSRPKTTYMYLAILLSSYLFVNEIVSNEIKNLKREETIIFVLVKYANLFTVICSVISGKLHYKVIHKNPKNKNHKILKLSVTSKRNVSPLLGDLVRNKSFISV